MDSAVLDDRRGRRPLHRYTLDGMRVTYGDLARMTGLSYHTVWYRLVKIGMTPEEVVSVPKRSKQRLKLNGRYVTYWEVEQKLHFRYCTLYRRAQVHGTTVQQEIDMEWARQHFQQG